MKEMKIGFIGYGNMAQAIATGLIASKAAAGSRMCACAGNFDKLCRNAEKTGIVPLRTAEEVIENSDFVILAVKPYMVEAVVEPIKGRLKERTVISVVAGYDFERYEEILEPGTQHISTIPKTPVSVCEGIFVCESRHSLSGEELDAFVSLFQKISLIEFVDSVHLSSAGTLSGCTPALTAMYMEALGDAGVKYGISRETAYRMAAQMIVGTGKLYLETGTHPGAMKDMVCSPGGTTIRGVSALEKRGFRGTVIDAIDAIEENR